MRSIVMYSGALLIGLAAPNMVRADFVINFDSLPAKGVPGGVTGTVLADYLAGFGVSLSGVTPGTMVTVLDARDIYSNAQPPPVVPPSPYNVIGQEGSNDPVSYTLNFARLQDHFSFTRVGVRAGTTGAALPEWNASAFDASGKSLGTVGESAFSIFTDLPASVFTLQGPDIASVQISSNNHHFAGFSAVILDNFTVTSVPEPTSLLLVAIGSVPVLARKARGLLRRRLDTC
jgi:hypothetical protein